MRKLNNADQARKAELAQVIPEKDFRQQILDLARLCGWKCYFTWTSIHSPAGFPDLVMVRSPRVIFAELKSEQGRLTPAQAGWLVTLQQCPNVETYLWRPSDFDSIVKVLKK